VASVGLWLRCGTPTVGLRSGSEVRLCLLRARTLGEEDGGWQIVSRKRKNKKPKKKIPLPLA
jgi:hypothetical protein